MQIDASNSESFLTLRTPGTNNPSKYASYFCAL